MTRPIRWFALSVALAYGGLTTTSAFAQFEGLDLGASKKKKGGTTATKGKKGKKGKKEKDEEANLPPPPPETGPPATTSPAAGAAATGKPADNGKPADSGGLGLDLTGGTGDSGPAAKTPKGKGDKAAPTMSFDAV